MAKQTPPTRLTPEELEQRVKRAKSESAEQQSNRLKAEDKPLGKAQVSVGAEDSNIGWETKLPPGLGEAGATPDATGSRSVGGVVGHVGGADNLGVGGTALPGLHAAAAGAEPIPVPNGSGAPTHSLATPGLLASNPGAVGFVGNTSAAIAGNSGRVTPESPQAIASSGSSGSAAHAGALGAGHVPVTSGVFSSLPGTSAGLVNPLGSHSSTGTAVPPLKIAGDLTTAVVEDGISLASGKLTASGGVPGALHWSLGNPSGHYGSLAIDADGTWHYTLDNANPAVQALQAGQEVGDKFMVFVTDSSGATRLAEVAVKVTGTNDGATISGVSSGSSTEDSAYLTTGQLSVADVDDGEARFIAQTGTAGTYGHFTLDENGLWSYQLDNSKPEVQVLKSGDSVTDSFTVTSAGGTAQQVSITIAGKDDGAIIAGTGTGSVTEDQTITLNTSGQLTITDPDSGQAHFIAQAQVAGSYGHFSLDAAGHWSYNADSSQAAIQQLKAGANLSDNFTVHSADGTTHTVTVNIHGTNDAPVLQAQSQTVTEDGTRLYGQMVASDVDQGDALHFSAASRVAGFTLNADGSYSFDPNNATYQHLAQGQTQTLTIPITVTDSAGASSTQNLTIKLTGTNDGATLGGVSTGSATEDSNQLTTGQLNVADVDDGEARFIAQTGTAGTYGHFTLDENGLWSYQLDNSKPEVQVLKSGDSVTDNFTVTSADGTQHMLTVTLNGTNDAPVLQAQSHSVTEDGALLTGRMVATDVDAGDTKSFSAANPPAGLTLSADGSYTFDASNPAYQHLAAGQSLVIDIPVTVTDRDGATDTETLQITVTGTNDAPRVFGPVNLGQMQEDGRLVLTAPQLLAQAGDIDTGDTLTLSQLAADHGQIIDNGDGTFTFTPDANYNGPVMVSYQITDSQGASVSGSADLNVSPVGDIAVISGVDTGMVTEDLSVDQARRLTAGGQLTVADPDAGEDHFTAQTNAAGSNGFGSFSLDALGHWTYSADNRQAAVQQLKTGEQLTDSLTVTSADGTSHTVTVTIKGTNDAPVLQAQSQSVAEDGALLNGKMHAIDADAGETKTFSSQSPPAGFTLNADGSYRFDASDVAYQHLGLGQPQVISIPVTVTDSTGLTSTRNLVITLTGTNDAPQLPTTPVKVLESAAPIQGQLTATDPDTGDTLTYSTKGRVPGFVINPDGSFHFDPSHPTCNALSAGEERVVSIPVTVTDGHGGSTTQSLEITVTGTNDGPALTATAQTVSEGAAVLTGQLVGTDPDSGDTLNYSTTATPDGFTLNADGSYSFDPSHAAYNDIGVGQTRVLTIPVTVSDGHGGTATQNLQITVTGTNDAPVMVAEPARTTAESSGVLRGQLAATDLDHADTLTYRAAGPVPGFLINPDGSYTFNPGDGAYNHLAAGQSQVVSIPVVVTDGHGGTDTQVLQITVTGTDDGPAFVIASARSATEGGPVLTGQLTATDPDTGDTLTYGTTAQVAGFVLNTDGSYSFDPSHADYDSLGVGHHKTVSVPITVTDSQGQSVTQTLRITIAGTNDNPTVSAVPPATVAEDSAVLKGRLTIADVDAGDVLSCSTSATVTGFNLNPDGTYTFDPSNHAYDHLAPGDSEVLSIPVTVSDGHGGTASQTLQITVTGANDGPALTVVDQTVSEGAAVLRGQLAATDPDRGDTLTYSTSAMVPGFTLNADGSYSFDADHAAYNSLGVGHSQVVSIPVTVTDSHGGADTRNLQITVEGTDDLPVLTATPRSVSEGDALIQGRLTAVDPDAGDALTYSTAATVPGFRLTPDGTYSFDPGHSAYNSLAAGTTLHVTIPVTVSDGHDGTTTQNLVITVAGTNDAAHIRGTSAGTVTEDTAVITGKVSASGTLTVTDVDAGESHFVTQTGIAGTYGTLSIDEQGHWTYTADNNQIAIQQLKAGDSLTESLKLTSADGTSNTVTVTIQGTNDAPVLQAETQAVTEDGAILQGHLLASDVDTGDSQAFSTNAQIAGFTLNADGSYRFDPRDVAYQHIAPGQTETLTIPVTVTDNAGATATQNLVITITGTNDGATITGSSTAQLTEDTQVDTSGKLHASGDLVVTDVDSGEGVFTSQTDVAGTYGRFSIDAQGHWTYVADNAAVAVQALKSGQQAVEYFTVTSADGTQHTITVTLTGTNDAALISGPDSGTVTEDVAVASTGKLSASGKLAITDVDSGEAHLIAQLHAPGSGGYGAFLVTPTGAWIYSADASNPAIQALKGGGTLTDSLTVTSADGTTHTLSVTITGTNDDPTLTAQTQSVTEDGVRLSGHMVATDVDAGDTQTFSISRQVAGFTLNPDGSYTFDPSDAAYQHLAAGQTETVTIPITVTDSAGSTDTQDLVITVSGTNDGPAIAGTRASARFVHEDGATSTISGTLRGHDADSGDTLTWSVVGTGQGTYGHLSFDAQTKHWTYTLDNANPDTDALRAGQQVKESFRITATDSTGAVATTEIHVVVVGRNDAPVLMAQSQIVTEDGAQLSGRMVATDVDRGDTQVFSLTHAVDGFTLNPDGSYQFDSAHAGYQHLAAGQTETLTIPITVTDSDGASSTQHLTITISGLNDGARISGTTIGTVTEDTAVTAGVITANGTLTVTDVDDSEARFVAQSDIAGTYGTLSIDDHGHWTYSADNTQKALQTLNTGEHLTDTLTVRAVDGTAQTITITLEGKNDHLIVGSLTGSAVEDTTPIIMGDLHHAQAGTALHLGDQTLHGQFGTLDLRDGGHWVYTLDNANPLVQGLKAGETRTDTITIHPPQGDPQEVTITITGTHDLPVISVPTAPTHGIDSVAVVSAINGATDFGSITESATGVATGLKVVAMYLPGSTVNQLAGIPDDQLASTQSAYTMNGGLGYQYLSSSGWLATHMPSLASTFNTHGARNNWDGGIVVFQDGSVGRMINVHGGDPGEKDYIYFNLLSGVNANQGLTTLNGTGTAGATLEVFDGQAPLGHVTVAADGHWTLTVPQALADGDHQLHKFANGAASDPQSVNVAGGTVTITDQAASLGAVTEDTATQSALSGQLTVSDVDINDHPVFTAQHDSQGSYGKFSIDAQGQWHYTLDNNLPATQALADGQVTTETFHVTVTTESGETLTRDVTFRVAGSNDAAVISGEDHQTLTEDQNISGGRPRHDIWSSIVSTIKSNWAPYNLIGNAIDAGDIGALGSMRLAFTSGNPSVVDANGHVLASGSSLGVFGHDISIGQVLDLLKSHPGAQLVLDGNVGGSSGFYLHDSGDVMELHSHGLSHYNQANNPMGQVPIDGLPTPLSAAGQQQTSGQLSISDADTGENHFNAQKDVAGTYGSFSLDTTGHWTYTADNSQTAVQQLKAGATLTDSLTVTSADGSTHTVTVTIDGTNDGPMLQAQSQSVTEDGATLKGQMVATDVDQGDTLSFSTAHAVDGFTLHADGSYTFDPTNAAYQHLRGGEKQDLVIPITVTDSAGASTAEKLTITVTGVSHAAVIGGIDSDTVTEDSAQTVAGGQLTIADVDAGEAHFVAQQMASGLHGKFNIDPSGAWSYALNSLDPAVQALKAGATLTDALTVASVDGTTHVLVVTIQGSNDAPTLQAQSQSVSEDGSRLNGQMVAHDPDAGDSLRFSTSSQFSGFTLHGDGSYTFDPSHADYQSLASGQTKDVVIPITVTDGSGATIQQNLTIHVTGHDDRAAITGVDTGRVELGTTPEATGQLHVSDSDAGQSAFQTGQIKASFGSLTMDAQGHWTYQIDANDWVVQGLRPGSHMTDHVTVHSVDGTAHDIDIEVRGAPAGYQPPVVTQPTMATHPVVDYYPGVESADIYDQMANNIHGNHLSQLQDIQQIMLGQQPLGAYANIQIHLERAGLALIGPDGHAHQVFEAGNFNSADKLTLQTLVEWHAQGPGHEVRAFGPSGTVELDFLFHDPGDVHVLTGPQGTAHLYGETCYVWPQFLPAPAAAPPAAPPAAESSFADEGDIAMANSADTQTDDASQFAPGDEGSPDGNATSVNGGTSDSALVDYLHYADMSPNAMGTSGNSGTDAAASPLDGYLAAAGVDATDLSGTDSTNMPPTEILIDSTNAVASDRSTDTTGVDDASHNLLMDMHESLLQDNPEHHGV